MDPDVNYGHQSMDEIVFEEKNKAYGAYVHRRLYTKNLLRGLLISIGVFALAVSTPAIIRLLGLFQEPTLELTRTSSINLESPPAMPNEQPRMEVEQVKARTDELMEWTPSDQEDVKDTSSEKKDESKEASKTGSENNSGTARSDSSKQDKGAGGSPGSGKVWNKVELPPEFVGGEEAYFDFMRANMKYPEKENKAGIEGVVSVYYIVDPDGSIDHVSIHRSSGNANLDEEALRLISIQPKYKPGRQNGLPVKVGIIIEVTFRQ